MRPAAWSALEQALLTSPPPQRFRASDLDGSPEPVRRYFSTAIADGTPLVAGARLQMRGRIKLGRWLPFRAQQLLAPHLGSVWVARVGGVVTGSDHVVDGQGAMQWRLLGVVPVLRAEGAGVSRSTAGRVAAESGWVPTALAARRPLAARTLGEDRIALDVDVGGETIAVEHVLGNDGRVVSSSVERWGDPEGTGEWRFVPFGIDATAWRTFDGVTIPSAGRAGWYHGTDRWEQGEFIRYEITQYTLVGRPT